MSNLVQSFRIVNECIMHYSKTSIRRNFGKTETPVIRKISLVLFSISYNFSPLRRKPQEAGNGHVFVLRVDKNSR
jgi:hypothetical protein